MASDRLNQLGKSLRETKKEIEASSRHFSKNFPVIEEVEDIVGTITPFKFEFKTYTDDTIVKLSLTIKQKFRQLSTKGRLLNG